MKNWICHIQKETEMLFMYKAAISLLTQDLWDKGIEITIDNLNNFNVIISCEGISTDGID